MEDTMSEEQTAFFKEYKETQNAYDLALGTLAFDMATIAPKQGVPYRNRMISILAGEAFTHKTATASLKKLEEMAKQEDLSEELKKEIDYTLRALDDIRFLPKEVYVDFTQIQADSQSAWELAKEKNDYQIFKPHLQHILKKQKEVLTYIEKNCSDYDYLLDRYQIGMNIEKYDQFFTLIKEELLPFIQRIQKEGKSIDDSVLFQKFDIEGQKAFMEILLDYLHADKTKCYVCTSTHPFTEFFSAHEARITTHFYEENVMSAIFSTIHEYGHALYGLQVKEAYEGTSLSSQIGFAMHESQSRFMENHIGRNIAFWESLYPKLQQTFPAQLSHVDLASFIKMVNVSRPSFIRTEADELTYPIHILIRYELEKEIFNGQVDYEKLDSMWNDKYEEYLGIRPTNDGDGILQDMHWGAANLGYFPTYALGSAYAAQLYHQAEQDLDIKQLLSECHIEILQDWLKENIHQYGASKSADEILFATTHEEFNPAYYVAYLKEKYAALYELEA